MSKKTGRFLEAFQEGANLVGLSTAVAVAAATLSPLPLLVGLVAEAAYLLFVPDSRWYDARLSRRNDAAVEQRRQQLKAQTFVLLDPPMQERFTHLEEVRRQIGHQAQDDQRWFLEVLRKLDYLLEKFLMFAGKEAEFRRYLGTVWQDECGGGAGRAMDPPSGGQSRAAVPRRAIVPPQTRTSPPPPAGRVARMVEDVQASYDTETADLERLQQAEKDENTKAVLTKRIEVLHQRRDGVGKIGRILTNLEYQLALLEDTFGLINDQIRARSPEQVLADIEGVVYQTDSMTQLLEELAPYEQGTD